MELGLQRPVAPVRWLAEGSRARPGTRGGSRGANSVKLWGCLGKSITLEEWFVVWAAWGGTCRLRCVSEVKKWSFVHPLLSCH